jgi:hypothetical protein
VISTPENSNKIQKSRFWKEKSVEDLDEFTLGPMAQATPVIVMQEGNNLISQSLEGANHLHHCELISITAGTFRGFNYHPTSG